MLDNKEVYSKILSIIERRGPSLPIQIAKEINMSSLFVSAFLSELSEEKRIRISNLKVGGSPLYFLESQQPMLENFHKFLHPKEIEAFLLLKEKKILRDYEQEPAIRVALRSIRDFAFGFKFNEEIYWRYLTFPEPEAIQLLQPKPIKMPEKKPEIKESKKEPKIKKEKSKKEKQPMPNEFQNPLVTVKTIKKEKPKSEFVQKITSFLENNYEIIEEKYYRAREYKCIIKIKTELGPVHFLTQIKDKKVVSESDIKKFVSEAQSIPLPAFIIYTGELSKKAKEYIDKYPSVIKAKKITPKQ